MRLTRERGQWLILLAGATMVVAGAAVGHWKWVGAGVIGAGLAAPRLVRRWRDRRAPQTAAATDSLESAEIAEQPAVSVAPPSDMAVLIEEMLAQGRYALLLRPQIIGHLSADQLRRARAALDEAASLTPEGDVFVGAPPTAWDDREESELDTPLGRTVRAAGFYMDRYCVSNRQFQQFVAAGGYENMSLWEPEVWPALLDLVDKTGCPGPRYWRDGRYARGLADHPVTGICWYEAAAYARWVGKRLPTDAEWVKAAAWPVTLPGNPCVQRMYPWGDSMDRTRANLWGAGPGGTVPVQEYSSGMSVGGAYQMIGNAWEWTTGEYGALDPQPLHAERSGGGMLRSLRGGAFDTYFDVQATCQFQSGDVPLARKHNIGFRCALGLCDLARQHHAEPAAEACDEPEPSLAEANV